MTIIYVSDLDLRGSGYMNIAVSLCTELSKYHEVIAIGLGYDRDPHHYPFKILPAQLYQVAPMIQQLRKDVDIEAVVVALDIPLQERLLEQFNAPGDLPYIGIFPLEAGPLCITWAISLLKMSDRLILSRFGQAELKQAGVDSRYIPIAFDKDSWRPPQIEERAMIRQGLSINENQFVVLTVAENQERKNLGRSLEIFADFAQDRDAVYWLVTHPNLLVGWKLEELAIELGIIDRVMIWERGIEFKRLWALYAAADAFLLTSKAEGLAMPVLEAMSCRLPVVGTGCAAIEEHLNDGRGLMIEPDYIIRDTWGNSRRYFASREDGAYKLKLLANGMTPSDIEIMITKAQNYVNSRNWTDAGQVLIDAIERVQEPKKADINMADVVMA